MTAILESGGGSMRARHENGVVVLTPAKTWKAFWHVYVRDEATGEERRTSRSKIIGTKAGMRKFEAEQELSKLVAAVNVTGNSAKDPNVTFGWFYDNRFKPAREGGWSIATRRGHETDMETYIRPYLGDTSLSSLDLFSCQKWINQIANEGARGRKKKPTAGKPLSESVVGRCLQLVRSVLKLAVDIDMLAKNPVAKVKLPISKATKKPVLSKDELRMLFKMIQCDRDRLILMIGAFCAVTSSELFGLTWECFKGEEFEIRNTAYRGVLHEWRVKKKVRFRRVWIAPPIQSLVRKWQSSQNGDGSSLIFPGENGRPLWVGTFLQKRIHSIAKALGITTPVTFQVLRRSAATRNQKHGSLKDVQSLLGHANIETTGNVYMQEIPDSVREMVAADVRDVLQKVTTGYAAKKQAGKNVRKLLN